jgi:hypothetical protein
MSTWHDDEPLVEGLWFFVNTAFPLDHELPLSSYVAVVVGNRDWFAVVDGALSDLDAFEREMLGPDED